MTNQEHLAKREGFKTSLGVLAATLGSAVGLGNIWKFPYVIGQNGGAAFILVYLICLALVGVVVMIAEFIIGRRSQAAAVGAYKKLTPGTPWYLTGMAGVVANFLIMFYYTAVAGWVFAYIFKAAAGALSTTDPKVSGSIFAAHSSALWPPLLWQWVVLIVTAAVIMAGVQKGIERMAKTLLPVLFILLMVCDIRALTLPGASQGLEFLFRPDFSRITGAAMLTALGLSFFKLSVGMGVMTTYGSYIGKSENLTQTALKVALSDTLVSIMAGLAIFPAVFAFGFHPDVGPSLLFITIPMVFSTMPLGQVFLVLFFLLSSIAATGAMISLLEVPVAYLKEERGWSRNTATLASALVIAAIGSTATMSMGLLAKFHIYGKTLFDMFDFLSSNILLPIGGIFIALYVGWVLKPDTVYDEASNSGKINNHRLLRLYLVAVRFIAPVAIAIVLLHGLGLF